MTRKHFQYAAKLLQTLRSDSTRKCNSLHALGTIHNVPFNDIVSLFIDFFSEFNERFDAERFVKAVYKED